MIYYDKNNVIVRDAKRRDIEKLKLSMRKEEIDEVMASHGHTPEEALLFCFNSSTERLTFLYKGEVMGMFGISTSCLLSDSASIWLLTSESINKMWIRFLKLSRGFIKSILTRYSVLYNYVDKRHSISISWLKWCGADIQEAKPYGKMGLPFHYFEFRGEKNV